MVNSHSASRVRAVASSAAHDVVNAGHRLRSRAKLESTSVSGVAPSSVVRALKSALLGRPSVDEKAWLDRIELMRSLMRASSQELEIVDFGAGVAHEFDTGERSSRHTSTRTLAQMTEAAKPARAAYLLFRLVRELQPESCLELGACVGVSASYMSAAQHLNGHGRLVTLEGSDVLAARSARTLEELQLDDVAEVRIGAFDDTLEKAIADIAPVGLAFIDGHHIETATIDYMNAILPSAADEAILVFDDINWSDGMRAAWRTIAADQRFALTVDLHSMGLAVVSRSATTHAAMTVSYR